MKCNWKADGRLPLHALFGIFILRVAGLIEKLTGRERFFSVWITVRHPNGRIDQEQMSSTTWWILENLKRPKGIFAGEEFREWEVINIRISIWEI
jgi:hypothetical protein